MVFTPFTNSACYCLNLMERLGRAGIFLFTGCLRTLTPPYKLTPIIKQIHFIGARSLLLIIISGLFIGMVVALQFYDALVRLGSVAMLGAAVGLVLVRELGPLLTALVVIGRAGSSICAEIAIMRNENQIDALDCMAIDPYQYLIVPRFVAALICIPLLSCVFITVGVFGGYFVGCILFGVSPGSYFGGMYDAVLWRDILMCILKALAFATITVWIATVKGFYLHLDAAGAYGSEGVSKVTTEAVVVSSISVFFADYIISSIIL
jgi:phospholipid/cholesterol/gamma-HCH transport system permease protein